MNTAIILINVKRSKLLTVSEFVKSIKGVTEVYTLAGKYDLAAMLRVKDISVFHKILTEEMINFDEITHTKTLIALDIHSDLNIEKVFNIS